VKPVIILKNITKIYQSGELSFRALKNINLTINEGDFTAITGASGSGKSTLMNIIGLLDIPTSGTFLLDNVETSKLNDNQLAKLRNQKIGFIFQSFNLLPRTSAIDNVALPLIYAKIEKYERLEKAKISLDLVGLSDKLKSHPNQLSGGQQQRVAIARALVTNPQILLADEPTGNLDSKSGFEIMQIFKRLNKEGKTIIMITHEPEIAKHAKKIITIKDGDIL